MLRWPCTTEAENLLRELLEQAYSTAQLAELANRLGIKIPSNARSRTSRVQALVDGATTQQLIELAKKVLGEGRTRPSLSPEFARGIDRLRNMCSEAPKSQDEVTPPRPSPLIKPQPSARINPNFPDGQPLYVAEPMDTYGPDRRGKRRDMPPTKQPWSIFLSHSSKDIQLATLFTEEVLERSLGIPASAVFFSSRKPSPIPTGEDMSPFIRDALKGASIVVALVSQNFYESPYCMAELGAAWMAKTLRPLLVPPLNFSDLKGVLGGIQALRINELEALESLGDDLLDELNLQSPASTQRRTKLTGFLDDTSKLLASGASNTNTPAGLKSKAKARKK